MVLDVAGAGAALRQRSCIGREWGAVPGREAHRRVPHCTLAGAGEYFPRMDVAVSLGAQSEDAALNEEQLDEGGDPEHDVNEDGGRGIAERRIVPIVLVG
jgi:hypothetical protein